jgi:4-hydroxy-3-polyprenylbenzoate decarboxylase
VKEGTTEPIIFAITGASGAIYALHAAKALLTAGRRLELIVSPMGRKVMEHELGLKAGAGIAEWLVRELKLNAGTDQLKVYGCEAMEAPPSSGSHKTGGMVVVPCSMKTLAAIAHGLSRNLIERAADVTLKERRLLILVVRECPLSLIHLRNMTAAAEAGAVIAPAAPAFYHDPEGIEGLADFVAGRVLSLLGIEHDLFPAWDGMGE